jgi:hypothetical protein
MGSAKNSSFSHIRPLIIPLLGAHLIRFFLPHSFIYSNVPPHCVKSILPFLRPQLRYSIMHGGEKLTPYLVLSQVYVVILFVAFMQSFGSLWMMPFFVLHACNRMSVGRHFLSAHIVPHALMFFAFNFWKRLGLEKKLSQ